MSSPENADAEIQAIIKQKQSEGWVLLLDTPCPTTGRSGVVLQDPRNNTHYSAALGNFVVFQPGTPGGPTAADGSSCDLCGFDCDLWYFDGDCDLSCVIS